MTKDIELLEELKKEFLQSIELLKLLEEETDETEINTLAEPILLSLEVEEK